MSGADFKAGVQAAIEPVLHWYQSDEQPDRPLPDILSDMVADLQADRAELLALRAAVRHAHDTLWELNPSNYDHDEVCRVNDASVGVILSLAPLLGETHGKTLEWWDARAATKAAELTSEAAQLPAKP